MIRVFLSVSILLAVVVSVVTFSSSRTNALPVITDRQIAAVKSRCTDIQASLNRLEASDKLLRHNIGNTFLTVSDKLMTPLNQRVASNQLDGSKLVGITAEYTKAYKGDPDGDFYNSYLDYENSLVAVMRIDCIKQPTTFLDALDEAHQKRLKLREATERLMSLARDYKKAFDTFRKDQKLQKAGKE